jgi:hypothetical protein
MATEGSCNISHDQTDGGENATGQNGCQRSENEKEFVTIVQVGKELDKRNLLGFFFLLDDAFLLFNILNELTICLGRDLAAAIQKRNFIWGIFHRGVMFVRRRAPL